MRPSPYSEDFMRVFSLHPKPNNKLVCWRIWKSLDMTSEDADMLVKDIENRQKNDWNWIKGDPPGRYIRGLQKYLEDRGWEDPIQPRPRPKGVSV